MSRPICRRQSLYALFRQRQGGGDCLRCALHTAVQCRYEGQPAGGAARCCRSAGPIWNKHEECGTHAIRTCSSITGAAWNAVQEHHTPESALRPKPRPDETERGLKHSAEHRPPKPALRPEPLPDETERSIKHSAEHRPPKPALRPELRPGETERGIKHSVEHRLRKDAPSSENRSGKYAAPKTSYSDVRPPSGVPKRRTGPDAATGRHRPVRPKQRPRPKPKSRSRSISAGYLATAYRGSAAGPRAYTRKTERGIRMHELPSLRFTPAVTTATPVRSPPKRSPRLRRPRSWAQPSL